MSGGSDFVPTPRAVADSGPAAAPVDVTPAAQAPAPDRVVADAGAVTPPPPAATPVDATTAAITLPATDAVVIAGADAVPAFAGSVSDIIGIEPTFTSLSGSDPVVTGVSANTPVREVSARAVNMREGPSTSFAVIETLPQGTQAEVIEADGTGWVRVRVIGTDQTGWMAERLLTAG